MNNIRFIGPDVNLCMEQNDQRAFNNFRRDLDFQQDLFDVPV